ncbi:glycosyl transferase [Nostoc sp. 'Peltigera membranacea cyanobiont' 210A]|uniref:glycosyltransferase n=1 Tax=Nostoc sp. 'Peltigera membranacea cyanobiont' 210A TaxID=2014529 RepID=UPI000B9553AE|nr:glycosyltransferase [Nostoc sp. 'Peltigera membranacea cyanobiont' 210A]OYD90245.1 glycosyl transferase [Nostoc sp. 'Peltigera membranacea cyanobiont' 210A]
MFKRLAIFVPTLQGGGAERAMLNLARAFSAQGIQVDLVMLRVEGPYLSQLPPEVRIVDLGGKRLWQSLPALACYLQREQPPVMLSTLDDTNIAALWIRQLVSRKTRLVVNVQNTVSEDAKISPELKIKLMPLLVRWFFPWADAVVPVSQGVADDLVQLGVAKDLIHVIPNPVVSAEMFQKDQKQIDHPWFAPGQPPVLLGVGRLNKQKDFPTLIRAFAQVRQQRPARLVILGEGEERKTLEALIQELGLNDDVYLPGFVNNPYAYMAKSTVFVLSSVFEGLPSVLIEAMATGTPVVATDCKCGPIEILDNGKYGELVDVGDVMGLASAIITTLNAPLDSEVLRERAKEFSLERSLAQYSRVLQGAAHGITA